MCDGRAVPHARLLHPQGPVSPPSLLEELLEPGQGLGEHPRGWDRGCWGRCGATQPLASMHGSSPSRDLSKVAGTHQKLLPLPPPSPLLLPLPVLQLPA